MKPGASNAKQSEKKGRKTEHKRAKKTEKKRAKKARKRRLKKMRQLDREARRSILARVEAGHLSAAEAIALLEAGAYAGSRGEDSEASVSNPSTAEGSGSSEEGDADLKSSASSIADSRTPIARGVGMQGRESRVDMTPDTDDQAMRPSRWLRVRVDDPKSGNERVRINLPLGIVDWGLRMADEFHPEGRWHALRNELFGGEGFRLVEVDEPGERVVISIE